MTSALTGLVLVALAVVAATGHALPVCFAAASIVWLASLHGHASVRWVLLIAVMVRVPFLFGGLYSNDLHRYVWEGRIQWAGFNPYAHAPSDPALAHLRGPDHDRINHPDLPAIYPPGAQALFALAAGAGLQERGLRNLALALDVAVVALIAAWLRSTGRPPGLARLYAWCPAAVAGPAVGHYDPWMLLFLVTAVWSWERGRFRRAAALLGGAVLAKTVAVLLVPWMLLRRPRAVLVAFVPVVALGCLPYALGGDLLETLRRFGTEYAFNASLFRVADWFASGPVAAHAIVAALLVLATSVFALSQPRFAAAGALTLAALLVCSPTVHFWYLSWFLVLLPAAGLRRWTWPLLAWCVTVGLSGETYRTTYAGGPFVEHFAFTVLEYAVPAALAAWLIRRAWPRRRPPAVARAGAEWPGPFAVIVPCRGEAENLKRLVPAWLETPAVRIVLADTPTGDATPSLAELSSRVRYVPVAQPGYGAAVLAGLKSLSRAEAEFAVICDADHVAGPAQARALLAPFADPETGLVCIARTGGARLGVWQRAGNALVTLLIGFLWGRRFCDLGPFRALRLRAWPSGTLRDRGFGINVEMNVRALELGLGVVEVALPASVRRHGKNRIAGSLGGVVRAGWGMLRMLYHLRERSGSCVPASSS